MYRIALPLLFTGLAFTCVGCSIGQMKHTRTDSQTFAPGNLELVQVETFNGEVEIVGHDSAEVAVDLEFTGRGDTEEEAAEACEALDCQAVVEDGLLTLTATRPATDFTGQVSMVLKVPRSSAVEVKTSNGRITIEDMQGGFDVNTSNGRVSAQNVDGAMVARSSNGSLSFSNCSGSLNAESSNGRIEFDGFLTGTENRIVTSNGRVTAMVQMDSVVNVVADTSNGSVTCEANHVVLKQDDDDSLEALVGDTATADSVATEKLSIRTSNGSITIGAKGTTAE